MAFGFLRSLEPEEEGVAEAWDTELARRVAEIRNGQAIGKPSEQVFQVGVAPVQTFTSPAIQVLGETALEPRRGRPSKARIEPQQDD